MNLISFLINQFRKIITIVNNKNKTTLNYQLHPVKLIRKKNPYILLF